MSDWDQRELCSDGACVGVIGPDGTCKTCGRAAANWGDERNRGLTPLPPPDEEPEAEPDDDEGDDDAEDDDDDDLDDDAPADAIEPALANPIEDADWNARELCPDEACIGVIGANGNCNVCGRTAA